MTARPISATSGRYVLINEIKEVIVHLYAYCGFPRSIRDLQTFMAVLDERKAKGITANVDREATPIKDTGSKYERGKNVLEVLTGQPQREVRTGYAAFSPEIEVFLKEHLFADIFERDILSYTDRELATISALVNLGGVESMMQSHMGIALHLGITESQLKHLLASIEMNVGKKEAEAGRQVLSNVMNATNFHAGAQKAADPIFPKGQKITNDNFIGTAWLQQLVVSDSSNTIQVGNVTFEPGARTKWHLHPGGQILLNAWLNFQPGIKKSFTHQSTIFCHSIRSPFAEMILVLW